MSGERAAVTVMTDLRRTLQRFGLALLLLGLPGAAAANAQSDVEPYAWEAGDLALFYPTNWDDAYPFTDDAGQPALQLAQVSAAEPQVRPPAAQTMRLTILEDVADAAFAETLYAALAAQETPSTEEPADAQIGGSIGLGLSGASADAVLAGLARIARLQDGRAVLLTGRTLAGTRDAFTPIFETTATTIAPGAGNISIETGYAVEWQSTGSADTPFGPILALASGPNRRLYALDATNGLLILDATSGELLETLDNDFIAGSVDLAVDALGAVYLANPACRCLAAFAPNGARLWTLDNFAEDKPTQVIHANGVIYADDSDQGGAFARMAGASQASVRPVEWVERLWLATDRNNQPLALTNTGEVLTTQNGVLARLTQLDGLPDIRAIDVDTNNNLVLAASDAGVFLLDSGGQVADRLAAIVASAPLPGEVVAPTALAVLSNGRVIFADLNGDTSTMTAVNRRALATQTAAAALTMNAPVEGLFTEAASEQIWTFSGAAGDEVTVSAVELSRAGVLDVALRLLGPDGSEIASNDDQLGLDLFGVLDAQVSGQTLPTTGTYTAIVTRVSGSGIYSVGVTAVRPLPAPEGDVTRVEGELSDAIPAHYWQFEGAAGDVITLTMQAGEGSLDPMLLLYGPDGELAAWNDDAADVDLGTTAQIVLVTLPADGVYRLDATRFDGSGPYSLVVVAMGA